MTKSMKILLAVIAIVLVPLLIFLLSYKIGIDNVSFIPESPEAQRKYVEDYMEKLNERNIDIIFYQHDPNGPSNLKARRINALNDQGLNLDLYQNCSRHVLVLYDLDGSLNLSTNDIQYIYELYSHKEFRIVYLGTSKYSLLQEYGFISSIPEAGTKSYITWTNYSYAGFADDPISMPITSGLTDEEVTVYTMLMEFAQKDLFWN